MESNSSLQQDSMIDEAMMSLSDMVEDMIAPFEAEQDEDLAVSLTGIRLDMPVQIQVSVSENGKAVLGITPPLYKLETSFSPVFHQIRFTCEKEI